MSRTQQLYAQFISSPPCGPNRDEYTCYRVGRDSGHGIITHILIQDTLKGPNGFISCAEVYVGDDMVVRMPVYLLESVEYFTIEKLAQHIIDVDKTKEQANAGS